MKEITVILMVILSGLAISCAPVFSSLQSAKLVGKNNVDVAPHYTSTSSSFDNESEHVQDHFGLQLGYGLSDGVDLVTRYEYIEVADNGGNVNIVGIGPKVNIVRDIMAVYLPVGFAFGGDMDKIDNFEAQPTLLFTLQAGKNVEINPSVKGIIGEDFFYVAANLGLGLSTNFDKYVIRPEYGLLYNPEEKGHYGQFSIGTSIYFKELFANKK
jgi:hypothetical protein